MVIIGHSVAQAPKSDGNWLPLWTGLLGGILGVAGTYLAARMARSVASKQIIAQKDIAETQVRATVVNSNRIRWIEQLRSEVAGLIAVSSQVATDREAGLSRDVINAKLDRAMLHGAMIRLLLYPDQTEQKPLLAATEQLRQAVNSHDPEIPETAQQITSAQKAVEDAAVAVFAYHWKRATEFSSAAQMEA
ncbi:MAG TPA: hypothetical protein VF584_09220 [Longimicrobium sp.]